MQNIVKRAWNDTLSTVGVTRRAWRPALLWLFVSLVVAGLVHILRGSKEAEIKLWEIHYEGLAFCAVFVAIFAVHLWLAPYRIMSECLEELSKKLRGNIEEPIPTEVDASHWKEVSRFKLGDAACLWVGVEPHEPIHHVEARAKFAELSAAVLDNRIDSNFLSEFSQRHQAGELNPWPKHDFHITATALRTFARGCGDIPIFLKEDD